MLRPTEVDDQADPLSKWFIICPNLKHAYRVYTHTPTANAWSMFPPSTKTDPLSYSSDVRKTLTNFFFFSLLLW